MKQDNDLLVFGATGLLGQSICRRAAGRGWSVRGAARRNADIIVDVCNLAAVTDVVRASGASVVVNCAALVDVMACEKDPGLAYRINARAVSAMVEACDELGVRFVQISTDHFYRGAGAGLHDEAAPVRLVNEYARTKFAGESFALTSPLSLVVRTNIAGMRGWVGKPTFIEWLGEAILNRKSLNLFTDYYTSTIDVDSCAEAVLDLVEKEYFGLINVAASTVCNKMEFAEMFAKELKVTLDWAEEGSVRTLLPPRAESLGLDVSLAERFLGRVLPSSKQVAATLAKNFQSHRGSHGKDD